MILRVARPDGMAAGDEVNRNQIIGIHQVSQRWGALSAWESVDDLGMLFWITLDRRRTIIRRRKGYMETLWVSLVVRFFLL